MSATKTFVQIFVVPLLLLLTVSCASDTDIATSSSSVSFAVVNLEGSDQRTIPTRVYYPSISDDAILGVIIFSHGAFSDFDKYDRVIRPWTKEGYLVVALRHIDSPQHSLNKTYPMEKQWSLRLEDMQVAVDSIKKIRQQITGLNADIDESNLVMAGHSYGAITAMALAGAVTKDRVSKTLIKVKNPGVKAVIAMSPPSLIPDFIEVDAYAALNVPLLVQTGTADVLKNFIPEWTLHKAPYELSPPNDKWLAVGKNVDHYFGGLSGRFNIEAEPQTEALDSFVSLSRLFLAAYAGEQKQAQFLLNRKSAAGNWSDTITLETR